MEIVVPSSQDYLQSYLNYYLGLEKPGYAVLITGAWGTGKTHQVKEAIPENRRYYVSLFGLTDIDQVSRAVFAEVHPGLSKLKSFLDKAEEVGKSMSGIFALSAFGTSGIRQLVKDEISTDRVLIFDDLERSTLAIDEKLGVINLFVEQLGCKVIVIANDKEIAERFDEKKEKLIGQTIRVEPRIDPAFEAFARKLKTKESEFVLRHKSLIIDTFKSSGRESLRVLKYVVEDISRMRSHLADHFIENRQAMDELVQLFSALDIETRYGTLSESDLRNRRNSYIVSAMKKDQSSPAPIKAASDRYSPADLTNTLINDDLAVSLFIKGNYVAEEIEKSLKASPYFSDYLETPPWLGLYQFYKIPPQEAQVFLDKLIEKLAKFEVKVPGEILHSFSLLFLMSKHGLVKKPLSQVFKDAKEYIQASLEKGHLAPDTSGPMIVDELTSGHAGFGFWIEDDYRSEFNELRGRLIECQHLAIDSKLPLLAKDLLHLAKTNAQSFYQEICFNSVRTSRFASLPILAHIPPTDFLETLLGIQPSDRRIVFSALKDRYEGNRLNRELSKEKPWIKQLLDLLDAKLSTLDGFTALQMKMLFSPYFRDRVSEALSES